MNISTTMVVMAGRPMGTRMEMSMRALEAPSTRAVERLRAALEEARPGTGAEFREGRLTFVDPAGLVWEYATVTG